MLLQASTQGVTTLMVMCANALLCIQMGTIVMDSMSFLDPLDHKLVATHFLVSFDYL